MIFEDVEGFDNLKYSYVSKQTGGYISRNTNIFHYIDLNSLNYFILKKAVFGTPIFQLGDKGNKFLILSGVHGNELPSQIANLMVLNEYANKDINHTVYFIPFAVPFTTMKNEREYMLRDLNRSTHLEGSLTNLILKLIKKLKIDFVGDFHATAAKSNPGLNAVFSSKIPTSESFLLGSYISRASNSRNIVFFNAGSSFKGAFEDECNIEGIPAVTCEVLSPFGAVGKGSIERSYLQIKSFLRYFGID